MMWLTFSSIWSRYKLQVALSAILFATYPFFKLQALPVTYSQHWTIYLAYMLSLLLMVLSIQQRRYFWLFSVLSMAASLFHMVTNETYVGVEMLRPFILWLILNQNDTVKKRAINVLKHWVPYLVVFLGFVVWRIWLIDLPGADRNSPDVLFDLVKTPLTAIPDLL